MEAVIYDRCVIYYYCPLETTKEHLKISQPVKGGRTQKEFSIVTMPNKGRRQLWYIYAGIRIHM